MPDDTGAESAAGDVAEVSPEEALAMLRDGLPLRLVDCREPDEFALCRIDGAELLPVGRFPQEHAARFSDRDERVLIYCHHGMRSMRCARFLAACGHVAVSSLAGGIDAWSLAVDPSVPRY